MGPQIPQKGIPALMTLAESQHGIVTRSQLLELGLSPWAIKHRIANGRLHRLWCGVYAVGRPTVTQRGRWIAAVLSCGPQAVLSHQSAAALWGIGPQRRGGIEVSVPIGVDRRRRGVVVHRRARLPPSACTRHDRIPVTNPVQTLIDLATCLRPDQLEAAINEADKRDLTDPETLRSALSQVRGPRGVSSLRTVLDRRTFTLTDSELERRFLPLARRAGLSKPQTGRYVNGFEVDFYWPQLGLIVETDGLRYHRTPAQQARDRLRDQTHMAAGLTPLRFTHAQVRFEPDQVQSILQDVVRRLGLTRGRRTPPTTRS
jgi:very-short-patch-repair endonuclease